MVQDIICTSVLVGVLLAVSSNTQLLFVQSKSIDHGNISSFVIDCEYNNCSSLFLDNISLQMEAGQSYKIDFETEQLSLTTNIRFSHLHSLTLRGSLDLNITTLITCHGEFFSGLIFFNISTLILQKLTVSHCGAVYHMKNMAMSSALTIAQSRNVSVEYLTVANSVGVGLMIVDHQSGLVEIKSSKFHMNRLSQNDTPYYNIGGGGGLFIGDFDKGPSDPISITIVNCSFTNNTARTTFYSFLYTDDLGQPIEGFGDGGGVAVRLMKGITDFHVALSGCTFIGNGAFKGGGLILSIDGSLDSEMRNVSIRVQSSLFLENGCGHATVSGGGIHVNFASQEAVVYGSNKVTIQDVNFVGNCAHFGGGLYFYSDTEMNSNSLNTISMQDCTFERNEAHTGSAVDITPNVFQRHSNVLRTVPIFKDCTFSLNKVNVNAQVSRRQTTYGIATVYSSLYSITFEGYNHFENNLGTAIHIVNGHINMSQSSVRFCNNSGINGGAIALIGESLIIVGPNRSYYFQNNTALGKGGGLYVHLGDNHDVTASKTCFFFYNNDYKQYTPAREWEAKVYFTGNRAKSKIGHAIFATSLYPCRTINNGTVDNPNLVPVKASEVFTERGINISMDIEGQKGHQIATEGASFVVTRDYHEVIPGKKFAHGVTIKDDLNQTIKLVLMASIPSINNTDPVVELDTTFSSCIGEYIVLTGKEGEKAFLYLQTVSSRLSYTRLKVKLVGCPPGFGFNNTSETCTCNVFEFGLINCDKNTFQSSISPGVWAGSILNQQSNKTELVASYCPFMFCDYNGTDTAGSDVKLPESYDMLNEAMCGMSRNGITCGNCAQGYTTHFHSPNYLCKPVDPALCKAGWLFYILSELVPITVIFITVIVLNISFTSGAVNGFILFSQLLSSLYIDANGFITFSPTLTTFTTGYQIMYGIFNFDMFQVETLSFCIFTNASALDMLAVKYITIVYALLLIALVVWCMNKFHTIMPCFGKYCRFTALKTSVIHGISAFFILCYSQCIKVSLNLLNGYHVSKGINSTLKLSKRVALNGNLHYFRGKHLLYALPALLCLLTLGALPPLLLLVYPVMNKLIAYCGQDGSRLVQFLSKMIPVHRLKPLLDTFEGCFKDNFRIFAGLYFIYRWIPLLLTISIFLSSYSSFYVALEAVIIIALTLHILCQPYAEKRHNVIDVLLFADLALINAITFFHYYAFRTRVDQQAVTDSITPSAAIQLVLIYLPFLVAMTYVLVKIVRYGWKKNGEQVSLKSVNIPLMKLKDFTSSLRGNDEVQTEVLPHRLIADNVDYECYEDNQDTDPSSNKSEAENDLRDTY